MGEELYSGINFTKFDEIFKAALLHVLDQRPSIMVSPLGENLSFAYGDLRGWEVIEEAEGGTATVVHFTDLPEGTYSGEYAVLLVPSGFLPGNRVGIRYLTHKHVTNGIPVDISLAYKIPDDAPNPTLEAPAGMVVGWLDADHSVISTEEILFDALDPDEQPVQAEWRRFADTFEPPEGALFMTFGVFSISAGMGVANALLFDTFDILVNIVPATERTLREIIDSIHGVMMPHYDEIDTNRVVVAVDDTPVQLDADREVDPGAVIVIRGLNDNVDVLYVGGPGVSSATGREVNPAEVVPIPTQNFNAVWIVGRAGDGVTFSVTEGLVV